MSIAYCTHVYKTSFFKIKGMQNSLLAILFTRVVKMRHFTYLYLKILFYVNNLLIRNVLSTSVSQQSCHCLESFRAYSYLWCMAGRFPKTYSWWYFLPSPPVHFYKILGGIAMKTGIKETRKLYFWNTKAKYHKYGKNVRPGFYGSKKYGSKKVNGTKSEWV